MGHSGPFDKQVVVGYADFVIRLAGSQPLTVSDKPCRMVRNVGGT